MRLYDYTHAPNPRLVRMFLAEKGIDVPLEAVDIAAGENRRPQFLEKNPMGGLPVLELDDGTHIAETVAICRYFEERHPEPPLMGRDPEDKARVEMWRRRMELEIALPVMQCFRNTSEFFAGRLPQNREYGETCRAHALRRLEWLDEVLSDREYVAGEHYTIADATALMGIDFGKVADVRPGEAQKYLRRWHETVSARPSANA